MGWILAGVVAALAGYGAVQLYRFRGSEAWLIVEGTIEGPPEMHVDEAPGGSYYAILFYSYSAEGERYSGTWTSPSKPKTDQILTIIRANLPSGAKVAVRYCPGKPALSRAAIDSSLFAKDAIINLGL